ncbi:MAG: cytidyltransferase [Cytophagia bacterium]|nr:cytidyltransferase [Cytophagia bacterium]
MGTSIFIKNSIKTMQNVLAKAAHKSGEWAMFIGRWQPWHAGHRWLIDQALNEGKKVLLCIRDVPTDEKNPWSAIEVMMNLTNELLDLVEEGKLKIMIVPNIESINIGRGVGYDVIEHVPPADIHDISATKIREQMKAEGKL